MFITSYVFLCVSSEKANDFSAHVIYNLSKYMKNEMFSFFTNNSIVRSDCENPLDLYPNPIDKRFPKLCCFQIASFYKG